MTSHPNARDEGDYLPLVETLCQAHADPDHPPTVLPNLSLEEGGMPWISVIYEGVQLPDQGWKLHLSASTESAPSVLAASIPILNRFQAPWKCAPSRLRLEALNQGEGGASQVGKFITIYPRSDVQAVELAQALDPATRGLDGPRIPTDRALTPTSLVHYRYGGFSRRHTQLATGQIVPALQLPDGTFIRDRRELRYLAPEWAADPFEAAGLYVAPPPPRRFHGGRFLHIATIYQAPRNRVHIAVDVEHGQRAILKQISLDSTVGPTAIASAGLLRNEAEVLQAMMDDARFPDFYALFESEGSLFLAMEDLEAVTFERAIHARRNLVQLPSSQEVVRWGQEIAALLRAMHDRGWIHRDLKSTNVLVMKDGTLRLIDFDNSVRIGNQGHGVGFGTRGYQSPAQRSGQAASVQDDIYGLGAVLYFAATLVEPSQSPDPGNILARPVRLLNPQISPALTAVIERCLADDPAERFATVAAVEEALAQMEGEPPARFDPLRASDDAKRRSRLAPRFEQAAYRLADTLDAVAVPVRNGTGVAWPSRHGDGAGILSREINTGSAGALYSLAEFTRHSGSERYVDRLRRGAQWLIESPRLNPEIVPGLYVGEAGIAAALLRAGQLLNDGAIIAHVLHLADQIAESAHDSPDLFNGTAGRLRMHLWAWQATGAYRQLEHACQAGERLLATVQGGLDDAYWTIPDGLEGLSGKAYLGYSHGTAGIADALLELYGATGDVQYRAVIERAARSLIRDGIPLLDGAGLGWGGSYPSEGKLGDVRAGMWCHGGAGIALFLARAGAALAQPAALDAARRAARAVAFGTRWANPTQCHGLAGNIDVLVTVYRATGDSTFLDHAYTLGELLMACMVEQGGKWLLPSEFATVMSPDYMVGYAGGAVALLRLSSPDTFDHPFVEDTFLSFGSAVPLDMCQPGHGL